MSITQDGWDARKRMFYWIYWLVTLILGPVLVPTLRRNPKLRNGGTQRKGYYPKREEPSPAWFHGASAGDIKALIPTVQAFRARGKDALLPTASTLTNSGAALLEQHADLFASWAYLPYDSPIFVNRALARWRPKLLVLEYTEIWPNLIRLASNRGTKLVLHNGRFSEDRLSSYRKLFRITGNSLRRFDLLLVRDPQEAERAEHLGGDPKKIHVTGNTKFDGLAEPPTPASRQQMRRTLGLSAEDIVWVAGSTHEGEEEIVFNIFVKLKAKHPALRLVVAPRYVERSDRIVQLGARMGLSVRRKTALTSEPHDAAVVLDTFGELHQTYAVADLAFVGGSFGTRGGQNILEPAVCGTPVLFGPATQNFTEAVRILLGRGGIQVNSPTQLETVVEDLVVNRGKRTEIGQMAAMQVQGHQGAAERNAQLLSELAGQVIS